MILKNNSSNKFIINCKKIIGIAQEVQILRFTIIKTVSRVILS